MGVSFRWILLDQRFLPCGGVFPRIVCDQCQSIGLIAEDLHALASSQLRSTLSINRPIIDREYSV